MQILSISFREFLQKEKDETLYIFLPTNQFRLLLFIFIKSFAVTRSFLACDYPSFLVQIVLELKKKKSEKRASLILVQKEEVEPLIRLEDCCDCLCSPSAVRHAFMPSCYIISVLF